MNGYLLSRPKRDRSLAFMSIIFAAVLVAGPAWSGQLRSEWILSLGLAQTAANAALQACEGKDYQVSVAVVDRAGLVKVLIKGDGAGPHTLDSASRKAYTALSLRHATSGLVELVQNRPEAAGLRDMNEKILLLGGGLPIAAGGVFIGGIGVGGAPGGHLDEACAHAGIKAIQDQLK